MRKCFVTLVIAFLMLPAPVQAAGPVDLADRGVIGGWHVDINATEAERGAGGNMADAPTLVEVYTATWCENCVPAEHALLDAIEGENAELLVHHRYIGESEDPFGTQAGDDRWLALYGNASKASVGLPRAPPSVVFGGNDMKVGSTPHGEDIELDYREMFGQTREFEDSTTIVAELNWFGTNRTGVLDWDIEGLPDDGRVWTHRLMVVEASAYFPDGSNDLEYYEHVVRAVIDLDAESRTTTQLELPEAWDGDDLSLVLVHEWYMPPAEETPDDSSSGFLPGFLAPAALIAIGAAARRID